MLTVPTSLQTSLDARATTFCHCWRVARRDGIVSGFTDHDRNLTFNSVVFRASSGFAASQMESGVGLAARGGEAAGALTADGLTETDLLNGLYDGASVEIWFVDWSNLNDRVLLDVATIGEVKRGENAFQAELRSSAHYFDQSQGWAFQRNCSADVGDARCKVDLDASRFSTTGSIISFVGGVLTIDLVQSFSSGFFASGALNFTSGVNSDATLSIKSHRQDGARAFLTLWTPPGGGVMLGDVVRLTAGCDKSPSICQTKFDNIANFRGFPHMPGNDRVIAYPSALAPAMDGGSFFK